MLVGRLRTTLVAGRLLEACLQTGNTGESPGRPRRCDQVMKSIASQCHCSHFARSTHEREGVRTIEPGSQKTYHELRRLIYLRGRIFKHGVRVSR